MAERKISLNAKTGAIVGLIATIAFIWTFRINLYAEALFIPRVAIGLIGVGGYLVVIQDLFRPEVKGEEIKSNGRVLYLLIVLLAMYLYSWSFRNIGLVVSTFVFQGIWWIGFHIREAKQKKDFSRIRITIIKDLVIAALVAGGMHLLFIEILNLYMPQMTLF